MWRLLRRVTYPLAGRLVYQTQRALETQPARLRARSVVIPNPVPAPPEPDSPQGLDVADVFGASALITSHDTAGATVPARHWLAAMGSLVPGKGFDRVLAAFAIVAGRHPDWGLLLVGHGPLEALLRRQVKDLGVAERVRFAGQVPDPAALLRSCDLFVHAARHEGFPNALCEAMALGLPVVATDCPAGPAEIVRHGQDGLLVPEAEEAKLMTTLAAALDRLMADAALRTRMAQAARDVTVRFGLERVLGLWDTVFTEATRP